VFTARFDALLPQLAEYLSRSVYSVAFKKDILYLSGQLPILLLPWFLAALLPLIVTLPANT
jgi:hypothetical protein